jgi:pilus assembly protein CpaC
MADEFDGWPEGKQQKPAAGSKAESRDHQREERRTGEAKPWWEELERRPRTVQARLEDAEESEPLRHADGPAAGEAVKQWKELKRQADDDGRSEGLWPFNGRRADKFALWWQKIKSVPVKAKWVQQKKRIIAAVASASSGVAALALRLKRRIDSVTSDALEAVARSPQLKWRIRAASFGVLGTVALVLVTVLLVQGLSAAFRTSWPAKIVGLSESTDPHLSVEKQIPGFSQKQGKQQNAEGQRLSRIFDVSNDYGGSGRIGISPEGRTYLPPQYANADFPEPSITITVPVSQGRLLRFDEPVESVFIADPAIADIRVVSPQLVYVYGKQLGRTNLLAISDRTRDGDKTAEPRLTGSARLRIVSDPGAVEEAKKLLSPDAPLRINLFGRRVAISGHLDNVDQAIDAANIAETYSPTGQPPINTTTISGSNQINIRVRFAEISRNDLKSFGIDWNVAVNAGSFSFGLQRSSAALNPNLALGVSSGNFDIDLLIEALQANGAVRILAEPNLTAVTGETASFLAGGEVPIPVPAGQNNNNITVQYKPFGVSLAFTPTIVNEDRISLRVRPEVSSISSVTNFAVQGFNLPSFTVRRAETAVEVASGQTFALAGLFQREISRTVDKLPVLGDVPVLGPLFRSERYQRNETELVILITPYLVNPVRDRRIATPLDRTDINSSWEAGPDPTNKGASYTNSEPDHSSGFILK